MEGRGGKALCWDDCICPVCLEMFLEPVTLPCTHTFCKSCFLESVDKTTLCCPMCRKRVSTWARLNSKKKTLVNEQLWRQIQTSFPTQCQRRLSGQDADVECDLELSGFVPRVSEPGELRQEYEDQISKLTEQKRTVEEEERKASEEYIQRLLAEEEMLLQTERQRAEEDERLARLLSHELNTVPSSSDNSCPVTHTKTKQKVTLGQIKKFLSPLSKTSHSYSSPTSSFVANKENILVFQRNTLSHSEGPLPTLDYYGSQADTYNSQSDRPETLILHAPPVLINMEDHNNSVYHTGEAGPSPSKRKSSELQMAEDEVVMATKRGCHTPPSSSLSSFSLVLQDKAATEEAVKEIAEREAELLLRKKQEEEDWRLALLLQKEFNQEEKQRATDRRKGSGDAYLLRQKGDKTKTKSTAVHNTKTHQRSNTTNISNPSSCFQSVSSITNLNNRDTLESSSSSVTLSVPSFSISSSSKKMTPNTSSLSSTSVTQLSRISKQATLTDMFSGKLNPANERRAFFGSETLTPSE
ncbi:E3 ubiquitin-protein ligase rnf168 [Thalassophryne amazonica]|uniref:E3 ubiquitin-protein ligase rnf168 n=1 Tax=Thalassophryne amazonica TaxID=390379 RepID=UPI001470EF75|nr:E3 ubiquitin-protein ligase rnf168 [Thalassophryne amazonica]XP_034024136.1 E3 ubiquitin-protein ligase rnf168 [Thalassophryne amazonica]